MGAGSPGAFLWPLPLPLTLDGSTGHGWAHRHIRITRLLDPAPSLLVWITTCSTQNLKDRLQEEPGMACLRSLTLKRGRVPGVSVPSQRCRMREMGECHGTHGPVLVMLIYSLVCLCPVVLPKALCILSCPCKPFWREGLTAVLPSVWHCVGPCWNLGSETQPASAGSAVWTGCPWRSTAKLDPTGLIQNPIKSGRK